MSTCGGIMMLCVCTFKLPSSTVKSLCYLPTCLSVVHLVASEDLCLASYLPTFLYAVCLVNHRILIVLVWWRIKHPTKSHVAYLYQQLLCYIMMLCVTFKLPSTVKIIMFATYLRISVVHLVTCESHLAKIIHHTSRIEYTEIVG